MGVYENPAPTEPPSIVITEKGLYWSRAATMQFLDFATLRSVRGPEEKGVGAELKIELLDGSTQSISIAGGEGKYKDIYSMVRFLDRVIQLKHNERQTDR